VEGDGRREEHLHRGLAGGETLKMLGSSSKMLRIIIRLTLQSRSPLWKMLVKAARFVLYFENIKLI
jgi:hypothetical protein